MTTGMTVAEKWYEVAQLVAADGSMFTTAVFSVFGAGASMATGSSVHEWLWWDEDVSAEEYANFRVMLALFLALEAEDAEREKMLALGTFCEPTPYMTEQPPTADVVAEEEPIQVSQMERAGVGQAAFNGYLTKILDHKPERRSSWNAKLADGLRKWAHWLEERF